MSINKSSKTVIELMDQILKYVAFLSALISALSFGLQYRWLSYIFVWVSCITFTVWLIRMASERKQTGVIGPGGKPTKGVFAYSKVNRSLILTGVVIINLASYGWLIFQVMNLSLLSSLKGMNHWSGWKIDRFCVWMNSATLRSKLLENRLNRQYFFETHIKEMIMSVIFRLL